VSKSLHRYSLAIYSSAPDGTGPGDCGTPAIPAKPWGEELILQQGKDLGPNDREMLSQQSARIESQQPANERLPPAARCERRRGMICSEVDRRQSAISRLRSD
jgi:hypothetical protein